MKVLLLTDFFPPALGGIAAHVEALATSLAGRGHEVRVLVVADHAGCARHRGVVVKSIRSVLSYVPGLCRNAFAPPFADTRLAEKVSEEIRLFGPDAVHAHGKVALSLARLKHRFEEIPLVASLHDYFFCCPKSSLLRETNQPCDAQRLSPRCFRCLRHELGALKAGALLSSSIASLDVLRQLDSLIAVSDFQASVIRKQLRASPVMIPNFVDAKSYRIEEEPAKPAAQILSGRS